MKDIVWCFVKIKFLMDFCQISAVLIVVTALFDVNCANGQVKGKGQGNFKGNGGHVFPYPYGVKRAVPVVFVKPYLYPYYARQMQPKGPNFQYPKRRPQHRPKNEYFGGKDGIENYGDLYYQAENDRPTMHPNFQCSTNLHCKQEEACKEGNCVNPCNDKGYCAYSATCHVANHRAVCTCPKGYMGSPTVSCIEDTCDRTFDRLSIKQRSSVIDLQNDVISVQVCRTKCNANRLCKSFLHNSKNEECRLMSLSLEEHSQNFRKLGALKHCPISFTPCSEINGNCVMEVDNFNTNNNFKSTVKECELRCELTPLCNFVKYVWKSQTCEMFTASNKVCVGYIGLPDSTLRKCGKRVLDSQARGLSSGKRAASNTTTQDQNSVTLSE